MCYSDSWWVLKVRVFQHKKYCPNVLCKNVALLFDADWHVVILLLHEADGWYWAPCKTPWKFVMHVAMASFQLLYTSSNYGVHKITFKELSTALGLRGWCECINSIYTTLCVSGMFCCVSFFVSGVAKWNMQNVILRRWLSCLWLSSLCFCSGLQFISPLMLQQLAPQAESTKPKFQIWRSADVLRAEPRCNKLQKNLRWYRIYRA